MFYALTQGLVDTGGLDVEHHLDDIETLNRAAFEGEYEITAISFHAYPYLADRYRLMPCGASFGDGYGPVVVANHTVDREELSGKTVAIPGELTTAHLALKLWNPKVETTVVPFDKIFEAVESGDAVAGVVIHEGQLTWGDRGLHAVVDLGAWWQDETGGPLPLGANAIRSDLSLEMQVRLSRMLRASIDYALDHRESALDYAIRFARDIEQDRQRSDRFVGMYVNEWTRDYGEAGRAAVRQLLARGYEAGVIDRQVEPDFVEI
ncbi:MAG: ABC transporter substrate-binding protein [Acidobacteria bacterium]|nr:ABC transporter substrate-binding protein [Acidobacteriota bacterium]